jgi:hypothetical protein
VAEEEEGAGVEHPHAALAVVEDGDQVPAGGVEGERGGGRDLQRGSAVSSPSKEAPAPFKTSRRRRGAEELSKTSTAAASSASGGGGPLGKQPESIRMVDAAEGGGGGGEGVPMKAPESPGTTENFISLTKRAIFVMLQKSSTFSFC